jgi:hypothetical protein
MAEHPETTFVTHGEFTQFARQTEQRFDQTDRRMGEILTGVNNLQAAVNRPVNYGWLISGLLALGAFITLYVNPVDKRATDNDTRLRAVEQTRYTPDDEREATRKLDGLVQQFNDERVRAARWEGRIEGMLGIDASDWTGPMKSLLEGREESP